MSSFTARVVDPGMYYENRRNGQMTRVPDSHHAVVCDACAYAVHVPVRQGRDRAEQLRRDHLLAAHLTQLSSGAVVLTEIPPLFSTSASTEPEPCESLRGGAGGPAGSVDGTVEPPREVPQPLRPPSTVPPSPQLGRHFARTGTG